MLLRGRFVSRLGNAYLTRGLSNRASTVLSSLDIPIGKELPGVFDGQWRGTGECLESICPTTGEVLARVQSVRELNILKRKSC
jgi:aldehyde dehydrogenase family 7 member A1